VNQNLFDTQALLNFKQQLYALHGNYRMLVVHFIPSIDQRQTHFNPVSDAFFQRELEAIPRVSITANKNVFFDEALKHGVLECVFSLDEASALVHSGWFMPAVSKVTGYFANMFSSTAEKPSAVKSFDVAKKEQKEESKRRRYSLNHEDGKIINRTEEEDASNEAATSASSLVCAAAHFQASDGPDMTAQAGICSLHNAKGADS